MLQLNNQTLCQGSLGVFANPDGVETVYGVMKATFTLGPQGIALSKEQDPVVPVDDFWGDPTASSIKRVAEMTLCKPGTDVILYGHAYSPSGRVAQVDVTLKVGALAKTVRVFGNRVWKGGVFGYKMTDPEPFEKMPLKYELACGGTDPQPRDPAKTEYEPRNPIGKGLAAKNSKVSIEGIPLPNLEDPRQLIKSPSDRPAPTCFAPICGHWEPRKSYAGTYDQAWMKKRAPYLPLDFNPLFLQCAHPDLISKDYLKGGETVEITGASPRGPLQFTLPVCKPEMVFHHDGREHRHVPNLDMVVFDADLGRCWLVWRAAQVVDKKLMRMRELELLCPEFAKP